MLGFLSGAFLLKKSLHYLKVKENLLCYLGGRPFKVNQHETKKPTSRVINRRYACFFSTGSPWCAGRQHRAATVSIKPLLHPSCISGGWARPLLKPCCLTQSQHRLWLRWSHRSSTHAHSDAAGFSVINKKWRHEVLAGWPGRATVTFSIQVIRFWPLLDLRSFFTLQGEGDVTLAAVCRVRSGTAGGPKMVNISNSSMWTVSRFS